MLVYNLGAFLVEFGQLYSALCWEKIGGLAPLVGMRDEGVSALRWEMLGMMKGRDIGSNSGRRDNTALFLRRNTAGRN